MPKVSSVLSGKFEIGVLLSLTKHPELTGRQLSKKLGITINNLSAIKYRLETKGVLSYSNELNLQKFSQAQVIAFEECEHAGQKKVVVEKDNLLIGMCAPNSILRLSCFKTFEESEEYKTHRIEAQRLKRFLWKSLLNSEVSFSRLTGSMLEYFLLGRPVQVDFSLAESAKEQVELTANEKKVLAGLVENPTVKDVEIARITGLQKSNFSTIKKSLLARKLFNKIPVVNMSKIFPRCLTGYAWIEARTPWQGGARETFLKEVAASFPGAEKMWHSRDFILVFGYFNNFEESESARLKLLSNVGSKVERIYFRGFPLSKMHCDHGTKFYSYLFKSGAQKELTRYSMVEEDFRL